jgi:hypothetical protein
MQVYTITFRATDPTVNAIYQQCATIRANFAQATDNANLLAIFNNIAMQLKKLE